MKYICPLLVVSDINRSRQFYEDVLDQKVKLDFGENITFEGDFALHLQSHYSELIQKKPIIMGGHDFELYFEHDDIDGFFQKLKEFNVSFVHKIHEQPWKQRVIRFYDPDNHIIEVGESLEYLAYRLKSTDWTLEQISNATGMPVEFISNAIETYQKKSK